MGYPDQGLNALHKCAAIVKQYNSDRCLDYAVVQESTGYLYYRQFYADKPDLIEAKQAEISNCFAMAGIGMAKSLLGKE